MSTCFNLSTLFTRKTTGTILASWISARIWRFVTFVYIWNGLFGVMKIGMGSKITFICLPSSQRSPSNPAPVQSQMYQAFTHKSCIVINPIEYMIICYIKYWGVMLIDNKRTILKYNKCDGMIKRLFIFFFK